MRITLDTKADLKFLANTTENTQVDYAQQAFKFLRKTGLDIFEKKPTASVPEQLVKLDRRIVSFLKKRETDFFVPMKQTLLQQSDLLKQVLFQLDNMDLVDLIEPKLKAQNNQNTSQIKVPEMRSNSGDSPSKEIAIPPEIQTPINDENTSEDLVFLQEENLRLKTQIVGYKNKQKLFVENIEFLVNNIEKDNHFGKERLVFKGTKLDINRLKQLVNSVR